MVDTVGPVLRTLLDQADQRLVACEVPAALVTLAPGNTVSWDNCCGDGKHAPGGQLWVRLVSLLPQPQGAQPCDVTGQQVRAAVGLVRCMHGIDDNGVPPTADEMTGDFMGMTRDADLLLRTIREWEPPANRINPKTLLIEQGLPLGPTGFCGGFEWTLTFTLTPLVVSRDGNC